MGNNYKHLSADERDRIAIWHAEGKSQREIARALGRDKSSICRELNRNRSPIYHRYGANQAQQRAKTRKRESGQRPRLKNRRIQKYVETKLELGWSPELIAGRLTLDHPGCHISHEAIYQYVYDPQIRKEQDRVCFLPRATES